MKKVKVTIWLWMARLMCHDREITELLIDLTTSGFNFDVVIYLYKFMISLLLKE